MNEEMNSHEVYQHYWKIEGAHGSTCRGVCKFCGEVREFANTVYQGPTRSERAAEALQNGPSGPGEVRH